MGEGEAMNTNKMFEILGKGVAFALAIFFSLYLFGALMGASFNNPVRIPKEHANVRYFWECRVENKTSPSFLPRAIGRAERNERCGPLEEKP